MNITIVYFKGTSLKVALAKTSSTDRRREQVVRIFDGPT